ncbi:MAG: TIGR04372 family glycosyltransferase [Thalassobaculaceae bacterium]|nr:TIGR04372 family glycosyltransferase [Thalassobaculaceae bacterium]
MNLEELDAARLQVMLDPGDTAAYAALIRQADTPLALFRWFRRLALLVDYTVLRLDGDVIRRAMLSTAALDLVELRRAIDPIEFTHPRRVEISVFFAAAFMVTKRVDYQDLRHRHIDFRDCTDNMQKILALLSENLSIASAETAYSLSVLKHYITIMLRIAGFLTLTDVMADSTCVFQRRMRERFNPGGARIFSWRWTFAIGHMVIAAFLIKGQDLGLFPYTTAKIWDGRMANPELRTQLLDISASLEPVPAGTMYAELFSTHSREQVDGRQVNLFEACGIVADRAGDARGGILALPDPAQPELARFFRQTGLSPRDRIVTLHCREKGFRADIHQRLRNVDIATYLPAIEALAARGYRVVRLGDPTMTPLPEIDGVIDYARSPLKSDALDVQLFGLAHFHIGSSSGLSQVPLLYGTPCLLLNWYPSELITWGRRNWTILRPITKRADGRRVTDWLVYSKLGRVASRDLLIASGHDISDLTPAEILEAVTAFAGTLADAGPEPAKTGPNIGRVLMADDAGAFTEIDIPHTDAQA